MINLKLGNSRVESYFNLLGTKEVDLTNGLGFILSRSPTLLKKALTKLGFKNIDIERCEIHLQKHETGDKGFTDIEILYNANRLLIIEAKVGWILPTEEQLTKYRTRFGNKKAKPKIAVLSHCTESFAEQNLNKEYNYTSWNSIYDLIDNSYRQTNSIIEKNYLDEFRKYLGNLITMDREQSNWVYCVSLSHDLVQGSVANYIDIVYKYGKYFYPYNRGGWPKEPPNYIAFRYDGGLKSIHKVESFELSENLNKSMPAVIKDKTEDFHFLLNLGPPITPNKEVKNGNIWPNGRVWCMIDTLLTSDTIEEARNMSNKRVKRESED